MLFRCATAMKPWFEGRRSLFAFSIILAVALFGDAQAADPVDATTLVRSAETALNSGKPAEAIALADKILASDPKDFRAWFLRARGYEGTRDYTKAVADYNAGLKLNTNASIAYQRRGEAQFRLGHFKESIADFDKFIELMPAQAPQHWQ